MGSDPNAVGGFDGHHPSSSSLGLPPQAVFHAATSAVHELGVDALSSDGEGNTPTFHFDAGEGASSSETNTVSESEAETEMVNGSEQDRLELGGAIVEEQSAFLLWAAKEKGWIDLFFKHGLTFSVMDDILRLINSPYKAWKTITANVCHHDTHDESYLYECVTEYAVCPGHMCFVYEEDQICSECGSPRPEVGSAGSQKLSYIPLLPRIEAMVAQAEHCKQLYKYRESVHPRPQGQIRDFYDTEAYRRLCRIHGGEENVKNDIFISVSTDGFQAFKRKAYEVWPLIGIIFNLLPNLRFVVKNVLPLAFVPGPHEPTNLQSFLKPLIRELEDLNRNGGLPLEFHDGTARRVRVHLLWFTGDLPAVKKCSGVKGHNGKRPCRFCLIEGMWSMVHRHNYYPSRCSCEGGGMEERFSPSHLPLRTVEHTLQTLDDIECSSGQQRSS